MSTRISFPIIAALFLVMAFDGPEPAAVAAPDDAPRYQQLLLKVDSLERKLASQSTEMNDLRSRLVRMERASQSTSTKTTATTLSQTELANLKRDATSMKSRLGRLETRITGFERGNLQREVDSLDRKVSSLQREVARLKSR